MEQNIFNSTTCCESDSEERKSKSDLIPISLFILAMIIYAFLATKFLIVDASHVDKGHTFANNSSSVKSNRYFWVGALAKNQLTIMDNHKCLELQYIDFYAELVCSAYEFRDSKARMFMAGARVTNHKLFFPIEIK